MKDAEYPQNSHFYQICIAGHLSPTRIKDFKGLQVTLLPQGETVISGPVKDQADLFGILIRIRDLGIPLLSISKVETEEDKTLSTNINRRSK